MGVWRRSHRPGSFRDSRLRAGQKVRFRKLGDDGDLSRAAIMTIAENRGPRLLVTDKRLAHFRITPTMSVDAVDVRLHRRGVPRKSVGHGGPIRVRASVRGGRHVRAYLRRAAGR